METLPPEMVVEVGQYLTPRDLASCSAVCQSWRDIFNNDSLWQRHCDPLLAAPLENTPCVVEPRFVSPEVDNSTLTSISHWHMAFLREQHLWVNYKRGNHKKYDLQGFNIEQEFLSNTLLVRCFENRIEIWDVSTVPPSIIASVNLEGIYYFKVYRRDRLLVSHKDSIKVFHVDPSENNVIELVHDISVDSLTPGHPIIEELPYSVSGGIYIHVNADRLNFDVIDLENGMKIKSEPCPDLRKGNQNATISQIYSSLNSEYVIVIVYVPWSIGEKYHSYVYSVGQLAFSSRPIYTGPKIPSYYAINGDYLAFSTCYSFEIYNCFTLELVSKRSSQRYGCPLVLNDGFVCLYRNFENLAECYIETFSLTTKTWTTVSLGQLNNSISYCFGFKIINNKFIECYSFFCNEVVGVGVWEASGLTLKRSDIPAIHGGTYNGIINESFTRRIGIDDDDDEEWQVYYYW